MGTRLAWYAVISTAAAGGVIISAFNQRANFYSACVYLAQSNLCLMIIINLILFIFTSFMYGLQRLCYGPLRPIEVEQLYEKGWFAITETCLAMTIFREEVGAWFLVMFVALFTGKVWGWIGDGRVEVMEQQPPANPRLFHIRLSISLALSVLYDAWLMSYTVETVVRQARPNMMVMFLFEFAVLTTSSLSTACRYGISLVEQRVVKRQTKERLIERRREVREQREEMIRQREAAAAANVEGGETTAVPTGPLPSEDDVEEMDIEVPGWEAKGQWVLTLDLVTDFMKLIIYTSFFFILLTFYGLPIHIMRDLFVTARSFLKRTAAFIRYRRATHDMNKRYEDATVEDIQREDTCIICREEMRPWSVTNPPVPAGAPARPGSVNERNRPKKLPCGHILHLGCLKSWLERQQVCPTCRRPVVDNPPDANAPQNANGQNNNQRPQWPHQQAGANGGPGAPQGANRGRMRMLNLGPLRLGFGQGNLNDFAGLQDPPVGQGNPGAANPGVYGMGLGFPRQPQPQPQNGENAATNGLFQSPPPNQFSQQLRELEQQVMQEIRALQLTQQELNITNLLQIELVRLRALQRNNADPISANFTIPQPPEPLRTRSIISPTFSRTPNPPNMQRHGARPSVSAIPSGSADLPPGVVIPEGWSLLPLQRMDVPGQPQPQTVSSNESVAGSSTVSAAGSELPNATSGTVVDPSSTITPDASSIALAVPLTNAEVIADDSSDDTNHIHTPPYNHFDQTTSMLAGGSTDVRTGAEAESSNLPRMGENDDEDGGVEGLIEGLPDWGANQMFGGVDTAILNEPADQQAATEENDEVGGGDSGESSSRDRQRDPNPGADDSELRRREKGKAKAATVEDGDGE